MNIDRKILNVGKLSPAVSKDSTSWPSRAYPRNARWFNIQKSIINSPNQHTYQNKIMELLTRFR